MLQLARVNHSLSIDSNKVERGSARVIGARPRAGPPIEHPAHATTVWSDGSRDVPPGLHGTEVEKATVCRLYDLHRLSTFHTLNRPILSSPHLHRSSMDALDVQVPLTTNEDDKSLKRKRGESQEPEDDARIDFLERPDDFPAFEKSLQFLTSAKRIIER